MNFDFNRGLNFALQIEERGTYHFTTKIHYLAIITDPIQIRQITQIFLTQIIAITVVKIVKAKIIYVKCQICQGLMGRLFTEFI
uniref:Uncharacterized protein n=1 Tax=Acrobeloides nanus TaxID=290746 RepID=A0A914CX27_9BILA